MAERLHQNAEALERVEIEKLRCGDSLEITTGEGDDRWTYFFTVDEAARFPKGRLSAITPKGVFTHTMPFELMGAGNWTTRKQNPVQDQEKGFTSYFDAVYLGGNLTGLLGDERERVVFSEPGQTISYITLEHS